MCLLKKKPNKEPAGSAASTLSTELKLVGSPRSSLLWVLEASHHPELAGPAGSEHQ